jgi:hypothetical protein
MLEILEQKHQAEDEANNGTGKESESSFREPSPSPMTQHRNMHLNVINQKFKKHLIKLNPEHGQIYDIKTKLALVNRVREINKRKSISHKVAVKHLDYAQLDVEGLGPDEAKDCLNQILEPVGAMRTLDEMLTDYLENYQKYELKKALHAPKLPANPVMRYIQHHRAELEKKLIKKNPNERIKLVNFILFY